MKRRTLAFLLALSLLAVLVSLYTTSTGVGLGPDSYIYVASARSLLKGDGVRIPQGDQLVYTAHFPPLYAGLLALGSLGAVDPLIAARWLNAVLFGANLFLVGLAIYRLSRGSSLAAGLGAAVFLGADGLLSIHAQVWSEPPFFFFTLLSLLLLSRYLEEGKPALWIGAAVTAALAFLVRYAGAVLVLAEAAALFSPVGQFAKLPHTQEKNVGQFGKLSYFWAWLVRSTRPAALFLIVSAAPPGLWMLYNLLQAGSLADRALSRHPVSLRDLEQGVATAATWIFPGAPGSPILELLALAAILAGLAGLCVSLRHWIKGEKAKVRYDQSSETLRSLPFELFTLAYIGFLLLSLSLLDAQTGLDARILFPIYISALILVVGNLARWLPKVPGKLRWALLALCAVFTGAQLLAGGRMVQDLHAGNEKGYTSDYWLHSRLLQQVAALPADVPIYSNGHDVIYLLTGKPAISVPREISPNTLKPNPGFETEMQAMRSALEGKNGVLVVFYDLQDRRRYLPSEYELNELLPLKRVTRWKNEGVLYRIQK